MLPRRAISLHIGRACSTGCECLLPQKGSLVPPKPPTVSHELYRTGIPLLAICMLQGLSKSIRSTQSMTSPSSSSFVLEDAAANSKDAKKKRTYALGWLKLRAKKVVPLKLRFHDLVEQTDASKVVRQAQLRINKHIRGLMIVLCFMTNRNLFRMRCDRFINRFDEQLYGSG